MDTKFYTLLDLAERWKVSVKTLRREVAKYKDSNGKFGLKAALFAGKWNVRSDWVEEYENGNVGQGKKEGSEGS